MVQILVLILIIALAVKLCVYLFHLVSDKIAANKEMAAEDAEVEAKRNLVDSKIKEAKKQHLDKGQRAKLREAQAKERDAYLENFHITLYQLIYIFLIACVLGLILEEVWMYINFGIKESRVGMVWGPFSPLYGFGAVLLTVVLWGLRKRPTWQIYLISAALGTGLEQVTGWAMETFAHAESWNYLGLPDHITKWTAWRFVIIWGFLGLIWLRVILPELLFRIRRASTGKGRVIVVVALAVFLVFDALVTVTCFSRNTARAEGIPAANGFEEWIDEHYDEQFIDERFENLTVEDSGSFTGE
ncbi:MAG: putative ABC transporter permease [Atopobiaceae bacterium]|jgi:uncharacterized membrane protein|nr:putative ABC transporter permease [Atopobiaceae bacterium]MCH4180401.1 putative ABC transporter permease [Atopobiaceae bacterium]MCH4214507.1 putative ABC transporter permease [Atopobiaceae bacterium]MCH4230586.1 putative ABC transporter permease [Atopobiaceae bacterium]MCH4276281.1 putative ABC transporter permease [Atopobiaceae bacterium]